MRSIGFGVERVALVALAWPRAATVLFAAVLTVLGYGLTRITFDEDLRTVFAGPSDVYLAYDKATGDFVDPENETLLLVEGEIGQPQNLARLAQLQFDLQLVDGIDTVYSLFALRDPPDAEDNAPVLVSDPAAGINPALAARIRTHPILGSKLLSADGTAMLYIVTPAEPKAPLAVTNALNATIDAMAKRALAGTGVVATVTGFPAIRGGIVDIVRRDAIKLNAAGALIGFLMSLIVFRSLIAALLTAVPAVLGGISVLGIMGLTGTPVTIMSNVVPALVMILGYVDAMHLTEAWREHRDSGSSVAAAEHQAQKEVGAACVLAAITTAVAFLSLLIGDVSMVVDFGWVGAVGTMVGSVVVLVSHSLGALAIGRYWRNRADRTPTLLHIFAPPSAAVGSFAVRYARPIGVLSIIVFFVFLFLHYSVPPEHSVREHLPSNNPANAALGRVDSAFDGIFPIEVVVPLKGIEPGSPEALRKIGAVHRAVAAVEGVGAPLSLWSLVEWLGGDADAETEARLAAILEEFGETTRSRFLGKSEAALIGINIQERPSYLTVPLLDAIEKAARAAGGDDVIVTGGTVLSTRESIDTIDNLNLSLTLDVLSNLVIIMIAFGSVSTGLVSFLPNIIPILGVGTFLFFLGRGMQMTSVVALTVAFGIAVDNTIHYVNRFHVLRSRGKGLPRRLIKTSRTVGPVMLGTTVIVITGLATTLTSGLPTIALFGLITAATLAGALFGDLVVLPALMAGFARRWFEPKSKKDAASPRSRVPD